MTCRCVRSSVGPGFDSVGPGTAEDSFHGTGISIFQHPRCEASGVERTTMTTLNNSHNISTRRFDKLPPSYTDVPPVTLCKKDPVPPKVEGSIKVDRLLIPEAMQREYRYVYTNSSCTS